jgi:hypothetical protein
MKINIRENGKGNQELLDNPEKLETGYVTEVVNLVTVE